MNEKIHDIRTFQGKYYHDNIPENKTITWISKYVFIVNDDKIFDFYANPLTERED